MEMSKRVASLWKPKKQGGKAALNGILDVCGIPVRVSMFPNTDENKKENSPDYHLVSFGIDQAVPQGDTGRDNAPDDLPPGF